MSHANHLLGVWVTLAKILKQSNEDNLILTQRGCGLDGGCIVMSCKLT